MGIMRLPFPEEFGGAGAGTISFAIVAEELSRVCSFCRNHLDNVKVPKANGFKQILSTLYGKRIGIAQAAF